MSRHFCCAVAIWTAAGFCAVARAERPMVVDDAGTLGKGGVKFEGGWSRDGAARAWEGMFGLAPIEKLEVGVSALGARDQIDGIESRLSVRGYAVKWVPIEDLLGWSAGLKFESGRNRRKDQSGTVERSREKTLMALLSWTRVPAQALHLNLGQAWQQSEGGSTRETRWGLGYEYALRQDLSLTLETYGTKSNGTNRQLGLRWQLSEGFKLSVAAGQGQGRNTAQLGMAREF